MNDAMPGLRDRQLRALGVHPVLGTALVMTGTALTEAEEFKEIYGLEVIVVPTHRPMVRNDQPDAALASGPGAPELTGALGPSGQRAEPPIHTFQYG